MTSFLIRKIIDINKYTQNVGAVESNSSFCFVKCTYIFVFVYFAIVVKIEKEKEKPISRAMASINDETVTLKVGHIIDSDSPCLSDSYRF